MLKGFKYHVRTASRIYVGICGESHVLLDHTDEEESVTCDVCRAILLREQF